MDEGIKVKKYYCKKCRKFHFRGKIYKAHFKYKKDTLPANSSKRKLQRKSLDKEISLNNIDYSKLRPIAQRQLSNLILKLKTTNTYSSIYKEEINKLINYELNNLGERFD